MGIRKKRNRKKLNLLEIPQHKRIKLIKEAREKIQQKIIEAKLWQSLLETEKLTINGNVVFDSNQPLRGFSC